MDDLEVERRHFLEAIGGQPYAAVLVQMYGHLDTLRRQEVDRAAALQRPYHVHGLCAIIGYDPTNSSQASTLRWPMSRKSYDYFASNPVDVFSPEAESLLEKAMQTDGAILISSDGLILHSGRYINVNQNELCEKYPHAFDTYDLLQATSDAGTRHFAAIPFSAVEPEIVICTLRSDYPEIRFFQKGYVLHSTRQDEVNYRRETAPSVGPTAALDQKMSEEPVAAP